PPLTTPFPYTTLFRSQSKRRKTTQSFPRFIPVNPHIPRRPPHRNQINLPIPIQIPRRQILHRHSPRIDFLSLPSRPQTIHRFIRSEEHTSELQSRGHL